MHTYVCGRSVYVRACGVAMLKKRKCGCHLVNLDMTTAQFHKYFPLPLSHRRCFFIIFVNLKKWNLQSGYFLLLVFIEVVHIISLFRAYNYSIIAFLIIPLLFFKDVMNERTASKAFLGRTKEAARGEKKTINMKGGISGGPGVQSLPEPARAPPTFTL